MRWEGVTKSYGPKSEELVFLNASLKIERGEFVGIYGPSGVGKTTMILMSAGIIKPDRGKIFVAGHEISNMGEDELAIFRRKHIGIIFQFFNLVPVLTALENIMLPLELNGVKSKIARKRAYDLLESIGLEDKANKFPAELSGGEQQRIAILRAIVHNPNVILADEPTGNLDEKNKELVLELLKSMNDSGLTIILATHDVELANKYVTKAYKIKNKTFREV